MGEREATPFIRVFVFTVSVALLPVAIVIDVVLLYLPLLYLILFCSSLLSFLRLSLLSLFLSLSIVLFPFIYLSFLSFCRCEDEAEKRKTRNTMLYSNEKLDCNRSFLLLYYYKDARFPDCDVKTLVCYFILINFK